MPMAAPNITSVATVQPDSFYRHMKAIGKGESLRTGKSSEPSVVTDYMPWPEEYQ